MLLELASGGGFSNFTDPVRSTIDDLLGRSYVRFCPNDVWKPSVNVYETPTNFLVCADLAGMKADDIQVTVLNNKLTIRGGRTPPVPVGVTGGDVSVHLMEIDSGPFRREIEFREPVRQSSISAKYVEGLLWITVPKE